MEDTYFLDLNFVDKGWIFGGVYDGHGGSFAAEYTGQNLHHKFLAKLLSGLFPQQAFGETYEEISEELEEQTSGTTAVNFLIKPAHRENAGSSEEKAGRIFTANAGDARALVVGGKEFHQLTTDHRLDNREERQRIEQMGAVIDYPYVYRGRCGLMPTRTIGDSYFKPVGVIAEPSVNEYEISKQDLVLIAACDGLFDVMSNEEVAECARNFLDPKELTEALKHEVLDNRKGVDNLTIIAVSCNPF